MTAEMNPREVEFTGNGNKRRKKDKKATPEQEFHHTLTACSRSSDLHAALSLYESAVASGTPHISSHHFNTLLHIFSNAPAQSNTSSIIDAAFRVFNHMVESEIHPTEATITSMARIAASGGFGDRAFELVKVMGEKYGLAPKLRTYGPAIFAFCRRVEDVDKAYEVEEHMVGMGVFPEEQELAALLKVSSQAGKGEKVYEYLQKLRRCVGCVGLETAEIVEGWFRTDTAGNIGGEGLDVSVVRDMVLKNGGGWHGMGWIGNGKWKVERSKVGIDGRCGFCQEKLTCVDLSQLETEKFAESVALLAMEREVVTNFQEFQDWLDNHSDFDAVIDAANVGFFQQNFVNGGFCLSQVEAVVSDLSQRSQGKLPLVVLHNKRLLALMENPSNRVLLEDWQSQGVLYATPNGSNDDWYWLYAAIKLKCLLVTNDEMRDHIFELLGQNDFPKWKERHHVKYNLTKGNIKLEMPRPYSSMIQESEKGSWHVPLNDASEERLRTWVCITRHQSNEAADEDNC